MSYIIKNASGFNNTRFTDIGRQKLSQGKIEIKYFQVGDSEISYDSIPGYDQSNNILLEPSYNAQNLTQEPQTNKMNIKYPFYLKGSTGNTYGLALEDSRIFPVYNTAAPRGFFKTGSTAPWNLELSETHVKNSNFVINTCNFCGGNGAFIKDSPCSPSTSGINVGDIAVIFFNKETSCGTINRPFPILTYRVQEIIGDIIKFDRDLPKYATSSSNCSNNLKVCVQLSGTSLLNEVSGCTATSNSTLNGKSVFIPLINNCTTPAGVIYWSTSSRWEFRSAVNGVLYSHLSNPDNIPVVTNTYSWVNLNLSRFIISSSEGDCNGCCEDVRMYIYPSGMTSLYDLKTPQGFWPPSVINFESICVIGTNDVKIWNMNIVWSTNPAGLNPNVSEGFTNFGSREYIGTKEYLGYQNSSGQTFYLDDNSPEELTDTFYYNSYDEKIDVLPEEQKAIAIVHYTNNTIDTFYGEKFAFEPFNSSAVDTTGQARNFKVRIPWLMWHKSKTAQIGETFYVDPNVPGVDLFEAKYMKSSKNNDMNEPGLRYYHLWDTYLNSNGVPNRVGKVFPDLKLIVFDDDEIVAALSYKSNRNWTLPAPKLSLIVPSAFDNINDDLGLLGDENQTLWVTYRFNSDKFTNSLHSNYYTKIQGPQTCYTDQRQDVAVKFGDEFPFMTQCCFLGFNASEFEILVQTGTTGQQPNPASWRKIDFTDQLSASTQNGFILASGITNNTFIISHNRYLNAPLYNLDSYIDLPTIVEPQKLNFGDEYFFYGNIETDIQATIYEMRFLINLADNQFVNSSNPTWKQGVVPYITELGLFDVDKDLVLINKLEFPVPRVGTSQFAIKLDF